jgi:hypothetical protein
MIELNNGNQDCCASKSMKMNISQEEFTLNCCFDCPTDGVHISGLFQLSGSLIRVEHNLGTRHAVARLLMLKLLIES